MHIHKILLGLFLILLIKKDYAQESRFLHQADYITPRVKSIVKFIHQKNKLLKIQENVTVNFDINHVFQDCFISDDAKVTSWETSIKYFDDKYLRPLKNQDTTGLYSVLRIDKDNHRNGLIYYLKNDNIYCNNIFHYGKFNIDDNVSEFLIYDSSESLVFKQDYAYNHSNLLIDVDNYSITNKIIDRIIFKYLEFDKKGNWIKRKELWKTSGGKITKSILTERKITYY